MAQFNLFFNQLTLRQALLVDNLKTFLVVTKHNYVVNNIKSMHTFMQEFINFLKDRPTMGKFNEKAVIVETLSTMGIKTAEDFANLFKAIKNNKNREYSLDKIKFGKEKLQKMIFHSHNSVEGMNEQRTIAIRSKYGNTPVKFYELRGPMSSTSNAEVNSFKMEYHLETACNYYEARPILYSTWLTLDEAHRQATCICDTQE